MTTKALARLRQIVVVLAVSAFSTFIFCQCSAPGPTSDYSRSAQTRAGESEETRSNLGTRWGERRDSRVTDTAFVRASSSPASKIGIRYTDKEGLPSSAWRTRQPFYVGGVASVSVKSGGRSLSAYSSGSDSIVVGEHGDRYTITVKNLTRDRIEVVLSVDGLDVLDGKSASTWKRGYVIAPRGRLEVEGFRRSYESVAAFRFGSVAGSYAQRSTGSSRNVGVIGAAVYVEENTEWRRRTNADPFPAEDGSGQFARPPR